MSIYTDLHAAGIELDSHESDLYAKSTPESRQIIANHVAAGTLKCVTVFTNQRDGSVWFDIPFHFDPWWASRVQHDGRD
jgi:hypothetical protein